MPPAIDFRMLWLRLRRPSVSISLGAATVLG
jgi:hypothetical protein